MLCVLFSLGNASALDSFTLTSEQLTQETCPTVFTTYQLTVMNTGDEADTYTVSKAGSAASWALISPPGFALKPGRSQNIFVYVTPSKSAKTGSYSIDLTVTGTNAGAQTASAALTVSQCHSLDIIPVQDFSEICTGESTSYDFTVENSGLWTENLRLSLSGSAATWSSLSEEFLRLDSGESQTVTIFVNPQVNELGDFDIAVTARSLESNALTSEDFELKIAGCYDVTVSAAESFASFCENSEVLIPVTITNSGTASNTYDLSITGAEWSSIGQKQITLAAGASRNVNAVLFPGYGVQGKFQFNVNVDALQGEEDSSIALEANVLKCHDVSLAISDESDKLCPTISKTYTAQILNSGTSNERFSVSLSAPAWVSIDQASLELGASGSEEISIVVEPPANVLSANYPINIEVTSLEASGITAKDSMTIEVAPKDSCFGVRTVAEKDYVSISYGEGTLLPIIVENVGSETEEFSLDVSGNGAAFAQLNPSSVTISGNSAETIYLYVAIPEQTERTSYTITVAARDEAGVVSSSSTIYVSLTEEPTIVDPEPTVNETEEVGGLLDMFGEVSLPDLDLPDLSLEGRNRTYLGVGIAIIIIIIIISAILSREGSTPKKKAKKGSVFQKFSNWLEDDDVDEIEIIDEFETKQPQKEGAWQRFTGWLEADEAPTKSKARTTAKPAKKPGQKKAEKSIWVKFGEWLEEEPEEKTKVTARPPFRPKTGKMTLREKFNSWLDEPDEYADKLAAEKKSKSKTKKTGKKRAKTVRTPARPKKTKGALSKFSDWLNEDIPDQPKSRSVARKPEPKKAPAKKKEESGLNKFRNWLEED